MRDYVQCSSLERIPEHLVALHDDGTVGAGDAIFQPPGARPQ